MDNDPPMRRAVDRLLRIPARDLQRELGEILEAWHDRVFPRWGSDALAAIGRDVAAKTALLARTSARELVGDATAGLAFAPAEWVRQVVLVPGVALRPFVVPVDFDATQVFLVSVSDEALDPEGIGLNRLAKVAAALGDPVRMRTLRELCARGGPDSIRPRRANGRRADEPPPPPWPACVPQACSRSRTPATAAGATASDGIGSTSWLTVALYLDEEP